MRRRSSRHNADMRYFGFKGRSRYQMLAAALPGLLCLGLPLGWPARCLLGWSVGALSYLALAAWMVFSLNARQTQARAQSLDPPGWVGFSLMVVSLLAAVAAIVLLLAQGGGGERTEVGHVLLGLVALGASWWLIHTLFALRYAHHYYARMGAGVRGGLQFPGGEAPDYLDFMYFALIIGMTSQVSDVQIASRDLRRLSLGHSLLAFAFNMLILALSINVLAALVH
jgi:uncharacterized membrane protein